MLFEGSDSHIEPIRKISGSDSFKEESCVPGLICAFFPKGQFKAILAIEMAEGCLPKPVPVQEHTAMAYEVICPKRQSMVIFRDVHCDEKLIK